MDESIPPAGDVVELDAMRAHITISVDGGVLVVPLALMEDLASGKTPIANVDEWERMVRTIIKEWLNAFQERTSHE